MSESETKTSESKSESNSTSKPNDVPAKPSALSGLTQSPGWKFMVTGLITLVLMIPALFVWGLVEERADRADDVAQTITQGWGQAQRLNGPYLVVPYNVTEKQNDKFVDVRRFAIFSPEQLENTSELDVEERKKSIYKTPLYHMRSTMKGYFAPIDTDLIRSKNGRPRLQEAFIAFEISDATGFRSDVNAKLNDQEGGKFQPGLLGLAPNHQKADFAVNSGYRKGASNSNGIHLPLSGDVLQNELKFEIDLAINGSRYLQVVPSGKTTKVAMSANWPHPGFNGTFLPEQRNISESGFDATWTVPNLARGMSATVFGSRLIESKSVIEVGFVEPLKFYQLVSRTLKYAIAFFSLVYLSMFIFEMTGKQQIHWIQYMLTGLAMVIFYILLLALSEHIGFELAYLLAASATTALISWYIGSALKKGTIGWIQSAIIGMIYAIMYLILKEDKYALLIGSIIAFTAISITMFATRNIDWSRRNVASLSSQK